MSNYKAITGSSKIVHRNQGGGSKLQGIPSSTNLNTWAHVAFRNRNVVCPCNRNLIFCMNQLGGVGAGGIPGRSYAFAPTADGFHKQFYCGHRFVNGRWLIYPKNNIIAKYPDPIFIEIIFPTFSDSKYRNLVVTNNILNIGKTYKVTIFNYTIIFEVISLDVDVDSPYNTYNLKFISTGNLNYSVIVYKDKQALALINNNKVTLSNNDTSFELSVLE